MEKNIYTQYIWNARVNCLLVFIYISAAVLAASVRADLVHHWPLDGNLNEVISGNNGTATGTVSYEYGADGTSNGAISVTASDFVSSEAVITVDGSEPRTLSFWFKAAEDMEAAVSYGGRSAVGELFEVLLDYPDDGFAGHFWGGSYDTVGTGSGDQSSVSWNTWTMATMIYDGTDVKLYQNGVLKRMATLSLDTASTYMYIGGGNGSGGQWDYDQFSGQIDEVKIWDIALTPAEVLSEYNQFINNVAIIDVGDGVAVDEESPASDTYSIVMLESPPADATGGIKIVLDAADYTGQLTLVPDPNTIIFTTGNWSTPQTVTVTAIDDAVGEGPHSVTLYHELEWVDPTYVATDPNFILPKIENSDVTVDIIDEPWWDHFPRIVQDSRVSMATSHHANIIFNGAQSDPGWGTYFQTWNLGTSDEAHAVGLKNICYYETFGQSMNIIAEIGAWNEVDLTPIYHTAWNWENYGGGTIRWLGAKNFFDDEDFARPYTRTHPRYGGPPMRYPDGTEATGYDGDPTEPYNSRVYDAGCSKNVLGEIALEYNDTYIISFSKDSACPMWIDYAYASTLMGADAGMDGMWTDNFSAWDSFNAWPVKGAFGDWSVARFRDYLSDNFTSTELTAMGVTNVSTFDIRSELRSIASRWGWDGWDLNHSVWGLSGWLDEPLWRAYTIFKRQTGTEALTNYSNTVHAAALEAGVTDFLIAGNDIPVFSLGWVRGNLDMVSTELSASWHLESGPRGYMLPPIGRFSPTYKLAREHALSRFVNVWLYDNGYEAYLHNPGICKVLYYEMLASHAMPMFMPTKNAFVGTETVNTEFFDFVSQVESVYGQRIPVEDIGIYYSSSSILSRMTPGGYLNHSAQPHQFAFWGWATALGELHYQYRAVPEWKLDSATLADLRVLVIPESKVFIPNDVANVLEPWVQNGGLLIVTGVSGRNLGEAENFDVKSGGYSLAPLTGVTDIGTAPAEQLQSIGAGKVLYIRDNIGMGYYNASTTRPSLLPQFADAMTTVLNGSDPLVLTPGSGVTSRVGLSVFEDSSAGKLFVDVTNFDIDINTDTITDTSELTFSVQLPLWLQGIPLSVHVLSPESTLTAGINTPTSDRVDITVQPLQYYASIVIEAIQVHYWPFNGDLLDVAGGNDGISNGTVFFVEGADGEPNSAIYVAYASSFVSSTANLSIVGQSPRTINFWFKSAQQTQAAISFGSRSSEGGLFEVLLNHPTGGYAGHFWGADMDTGASGTGAHPSVLWNTWTMATMTYDGTDVKLYQNDELKRTATLSLDTSPTHLYIGGHNDPAWYGGYAGYIDDVRVYNYALDADELATVYLEMSGIDYVCDSPPTMDFTNDCVVDLADLAVFAQDWLTCGRFPVSACP